MLNRIARRGSGRALVAAAALLALPACGEDPEDPFVVEGSGDLSGTLYYDVDRDGEFDPFAGDFALSDVDVFVLERGSADTDDAIAEVTTNAQGRFEVDALPVGTHDLFFALPDEMGVVCQNPLPVSVRINETTNVGAAAQESCLISIAEARELPDGEVVTVRGVVTVGTGDISGSYFFLMDETAGIKIFGGQGVVGQFIELTGSMLTFSSEREIENPSITVLGTAPLPDPVLITGAELLSADYEGSLATVEGLEVVSVTASGTSGWDVRVNAPDGETFIVRVDIDTGLNGEELFTVGGIYNVTGVVSPFGGAEQLYVRVLSDIEEVS